MADREPAGGPVRLQLSRRKGFNLQAKSRAVNGLPAVVVTRPGRWGNPFRIGRDGDRETVVRRFACEIALAWDLTPLRGRNLACPCEPGASCHADILLRLANC
jgi:hypothetical protein